MNLKERIGKNISKYRKLNNLKQSKLAELVNISVKHQSRIETGVNFPSSDLLEKYADVFKIDVSELLDIKSIDTPENLKMKICNMLPMATKEQTELLYKISNCIIK